MVCAKSPQLGARFFGSLCAAMAIWLAPSHGIAQANADQTVPQPQHSAATGGDPPTNVYSEAAAWHFNPVVSTALDRVYVPNVLSDDVDVIDPNSFTVVDHFKVGRNPQHVIPSWDLKTLWVGRQQASPQLWQPHTHRSRNREAGRGNQGARRVQHVFHP
jgi:YVTN family beta-propeller protein